MKSVLLSVVRILTILAGGYAMLLAGLFLGLFFAAKPAGECGLPLLVPMFLGALGSLLAFALGVSSGRPFQAAYRSALVFSAALALFALLAATRGDWETSLRLMGGAIGTGASGGFLGGVLGALLRRGNNSCSLPMAKLPGQHPH